MDHFTYKNGQLHAENVALHEIAAQVGTPFYCYSSATFIRHFNVFNDVLGDYDHKVCFAVKANSNLAILKTLAAQGCGADTVSAGEIRAARKAGIPACDIVFSGVGKTKDEMAYALKEGIFQFNAESQAELNALNEVAGSLNLKAPVALRVNPAVDPQTHEKISTGQKESKFGIAFDVVREAYDYSASLPHLKVQGVSMHIGSQLTSLTPFRQAFRAILQMTNELRASGHGIQTLDLGGGLGVPYGDETQTPPLPTDYAKAVREEIGEFEGTLLFEPGRMIAANAGIMITKVIYLKDKYVIVDAAMNDLMRPALYDSYHEIVPVVESNDTPAPHHIVGPVCESSDIFGKDRPLVNPKSEDLIAIRSCGAYGGSMSNEYNSRPMIPEILVNGADWAVIRKRPSYEEMIANQQMPDWL
ncbi:MAG: diaminopimelate decarboxylase [Rickettsiales bacterium]|nr:diaminopimelate decarboxylase [Rickettsiales bacterium]